MSFKSILSYFYLPFCFSGDWRQGREGNLTKSKAGRDPLLCMSHIALKAVWVCRREIVKCLHDCIDLDIFLPLLWCHSNGFAHPRKPQAFFSSSQSRCQAALEGPWGRSSPCPGHALPGAPGIQVPPLAMAEGAPGSLLTAQTQSKSFIYVHITSTIPPNKSHPSSPFGPNNKNLSRSFNKDEHITYVWCQPRV